MEFKMKQEDKHKWTKEDEGVNRKIEEWKTPKALETQKTDKKKTSKTKSETQQYHKNPTHILGSMCISRFKQTHATVS